MATRIGALDIELRDNRKALDALIETTAPELTATPGVGDVVAAAVLIAWSHPGRVRSEAAFAALAGTCPIPASSGNALRHRLNRGGDLNRPGFDAHRFICLQPVARRGVHSSRLRARPVADGRVGA
jgi:transposase